MFLDPALIIAILVTFSFWQAASLSMARQEVLRWKDAQIQALQDESGWLRDLLTGEEIDTADAPLGLDTL